MGFIVYSDYILFCLTLIVLILASMMDFKKREVYDFFSGSLIFIGLFIRLFTSLVEWNFKYFYLPLIYFIFVFGITYILYKFGQWGGGDSKILMGYTISASYLPTLFGEISIFYNSLTISSFIQFIILTMFVGMFYTIIWMLSNFLMNFKKGFKLLFGQLKKSYNIIIILSFFVSLFFVNNQALLYYYLLLLFIFLIINIGIIVEDNFMNKYIKAKDLTEGDWVINDIEYNNETIYKVKKSGIELSDIHKIIDINQNILVKIKIGVPFVPVFLFSYLILIFLI